VKNQIGRWILSFVLATQALLSIAVDWNTTHLFNPTWPPHAVFHDWAMINLLNGVSLCGLWLLWRKSPEPEIGIKMATLIPLIFWSAFFYTTTLLPNSSLSYSPTLVLPKVAGLTIYPNAAIGFVLTVLTLTGYRVATAELKRKNAASR
jgi:hypothetical protein